MLSHLGLVFEILPDLAGGEVPHLNKAVDSAGHQVLAVRGERCNTDRSSTGNMAGVDAGGRGHTW